MWQVQAVKPVYEWKVGMIEAFQDNPSLWFRSLTSKVKDSHIYPRWNCRSRNKVCLCEWRELISRHQLRKHDSSEMPVRCLNSNIKERVKVQVWIKVWHTHLGVNILKTKEKFKMLRNYSSHGLTGPVFQKVGNCSKIWESSGEWDWGVRKETRSFLILSINNGLGEKSQHPCDLCVDVHMIFWILLWS